MKIFALLTVLIFVSSPAAMSAASSPEERCWEIIEEAGGSRDSDTRLALSRLLTELEDGRGLSLLEELTGDDYWLIRGEACLSLGERGEKEALPILRSLINDEYFYVRTRAGVGLAKLGDESALGILIDALDDIHDKVGILAVEAMGGIKSNPKIVSLLREILRKEHHWMRGKACYALVGAVGEEALGDLKEREDSDPETYVKICAAGARAMLGDYSGKELILSYLGHDRAVYRMGAVAALTKFGGQETISRLEERLLTDEWPGVRKEAIAGLRELIAFDAAPTLWQVLLNDKDCEVKVQAALALGQLGRDNIEASLEKQLFVEKDEEVRMALAIALLNRIGSAKIPDSEAVDRWQDYFNGRLKRGKAGEIVLFYDFSDPYQYGDFLENDGEGKIERGELILSLPSWMPPGDAITNSLFSKAVFKNDIRMQFFARPQNNKEAFLTLFLNSLPKRPHSLGWWWYDGYFAQISSTRAEVRFQGHKLKELGRAVQDKDTQAWREEELAGSVFNYEEMPVTLDEEGKEIIFEVKNKHLKITLGDEVLFDIPHSHPLTEEEFVIGFGVYGSGEIAIDNLQIEGRFDEKWLSRQTPSPLPHKRPFSQTRLEIWEKEKQERITELAIGKEIEDLRTAVKVGDEEKIKEHWNKILRKYRSILGVFARKDTLHSMGEIRRDLQGERSPLSEIGEMLEEGKKRNQTKALEQLEEHARYLEEKYKVTF